MHCKADNVYLAQHHTRLQFAPNKHIHYSKIAMFTDCVTAFADLQICTEVCDMMTSCVVTHDIAS